MRHTKRTCLGNCLHFYLHNKGLEPGLTARISIEEGPSLVGASRQTAALPVLSEDNPVPPHLLVSVRVPSRGGLEGVSLQAGQPQTGAKAGQVNAPAVGERFAVQVLSLRFSSERNI